MGKWTCRCGNIMSDHLYPDKNAYFVFSEMALDKLDEKGKINDASNPTFIAYKCPECGRLMIWGGSNRCLSYMPEFDVSETEDILRTSVSTDD